MSSQNEKKGSALIALLDSSHTSNNILFVVDIDKNLYKDVVPNKVPTRFTAKSNLQGKSGFVHFKKLKKFIMAQIIRVGESDVLQKEKQEMCARRFTPRFAVDHGVEKVINENLVKTAMDSAHEKSVAQGRNKPPSNVERPKVGHTKADASKFSECVDGDKDNIEADDCASTKGVSLSPVQCNIDPLAESNDMQVFLSGFLKEFGKLGSMLVARVESLDESLKLMDKRVIEVSSGIEKLKSVLKEHEECGEIFKVGHLPDGEGKISVVPKGLVKVTLAGYNDIAASDTNHKRVLSILDLLHSEYESKVESQLLHGKYYMNLMRFATLNILRAVHVDFPVGDRAELSMLFVKPIFDGNWREHDLERKAEKKKIYEAKKNASKRSNSGSTQTTSVNKKKKVENKSSAPGKKTSVPTNLNVCLSDIESDDCLVDKNVDDVDGFADDVETDETNSQAGDTITNPMTDSWNSRTRTEKQSTSGYFMTESPSGDDSLDSRFQHQQLSGTYGDSFSVANIIAPPLMKPINSEYGGAGVGVTSLAMSLQQKLNGYQDISNPLLQGYNNGTGLKSPGSPDFSSCYPPASLISASTNLILDDRATSHYVSL